MAHVEIAAAELSKHMDSEGMGAGGAFVDVWSEWPGNAAVSLKIKVRKIKRKPRRPTHFGLRSKKR